MFKVLAIAAKLSVLIQNNRVDHGDPGLALQPECRSLGVTCDRGRLKTWFVLLGKIRHIDKIHFFQVVFAKDMKLP